MTEPADNKEVFKPLSEEHFHFNCYPEIACFTKCCAKLRLILTPYDILRIKNRLGISSSKFLDLYTDTLFEEGLRFPLVRLKMTPDEQGRCPFVTEKGCTIYEDRPGACRLYPIGRASTFPGGGDKTREKFFIVAESHCLGFKEEKVWTIDQWLTHEGVDHYNAMNDPWVRIVTSSKPLGTGKELTQKLKMFFMASYNLDRFRTFLFQSPFFERFEVDSEVKEMLAHDDVALMHFGFDWLRFSLFGEKTMTLAAP
ncbi:MAG: YkgJ family cysteine cluster protein [Deltaproteobacteria bacterium]|nr:YkgJ family cysteine cluster protein [Deltaproteobacteria bacterium]MBW1931222.1 YkgJ family cysteine cluster protein [Deltaproteobacteria bacterium]MBW2026818.1 YkgJ family cysteine cluster protein [Deltaproteobacteria bacterium]MBW2126611.1 YkgJ family cysteine cluster protein [Deltaproteobacteria bacterium]RLB21483.1 MAG: YkgJ family cysteine cluster protein [Deltaproteobacteria bacterium]